MEAVDAPGKISLLLGIHYGGNTYEDIGNKAGEMYHEKPVFFSGWFLILVSTNNNREEPY